MCGRVVLYTKLSEIAQLTGASYNFEVLPSYNIAPTQNVVVLRKENNKRVLTPIRWGLVPSWNRDPKKSIPLINARLETIDTKPSFKNAVDSRRCLVMVDGFYEWVQGVKKQPYLIRMRSLQPFAIAGIWEAWKSTDETVPSFESCSLITLEANKLLEPFHHRMPAILDSKDYDQWLDNNNKWPEVKELLTPFPEKHMEMFPVSTNVNSSKYNEPDCLQPLDLVNF